MLDILKSNDVPTQMATYNLGPKAATFALADHISRDWTPAQAATILPMLTTEDPPPSYTELARRLGKSRQAVKKALDGAGYDAFSLALEPYEREKPEND